MAESVVAKETDGPMAGTKVFTIWLLQKKFADHQT